MPFTTESTKNNQYARKYYVNQDYFEKIDSEDKAYLLGFIAADGCVTRNKSGSVMLTTTIHQQDVQVLEWMKNFMNAEHPIKNYGRNQRRLVIGCKKLVDDLESIGITQRKSLTMKPMLSNIPMNLRNHFIRGYFDGDGGVTLFNVSPTKTKRYANFMGTKDFLEDIYQEINFSGGSYRNCGQIWRLSIGAKQDLALLKDYMYKDATLYLQRKYERFE